jgi:hypothetical protein
MDRVKWKGLQKNMPMCHFAHHRSHLDYSGVQTLSHIEKSTTNCFVGVYIVYARQGLNIVHLAWCVLKPWQVNLDDVKLITEILAYIQEYNKPSSLLQALFKYFCRTPP